MNQPSVKIDTNIKEIADYLETWDKFYGLDNYAIRVVLPKSINDALVTVRTRVSKDIRARYNTKSNIIKQNVKLTRAKNVSKIGATSANLEYRGSRGISLANFGVSQRKNSVSVKVLRQGERHVIMPGGSKEILESVTYTGKRKIKEFRRARVWLGKDKKGEKQVFALTKKSPKIPRRLYGPSFMSYFFVKGVDYELYELLEDTIFKNIETNMRALSQGFFKVRSRRFSDSGKMTYQDFQNKYGKYIQR